MYYEAGSRTSWEFWVLFETSSQGGPLWICWWQRCFLGFRNCKNYSNITWPPVVFGMVSKSKYTIDISKNLLEGVAPFLDPCWYPCFGLLVTFTLRFKVRVGSLFPCFVANIQWILKVTSSVTPADLLSASIDPRTTGSCLVGVRAHDRDWLQNNVDFESKYWVVIREVFGSGFQSPMFLWGILTWGSPVMCSQWKEINVSMWTWGSPVMCLQWNKTNVGMWTWGPPVMCS